MNGLDPKTVMTFFPVIFIGMWFTVTTLLSFLSGWFTLMRDYGDADERPILKLTWQSATMGLGVGLNSILRLEVCPSGLRLGIMRLFGPFCRDIFIPWNDIAVTRRSFLGLTFAILRFGGRGFPKLTLRGPLADRLAQASQGRWPESSIPPPPTRGKVVTDIFFQWLAVTAFAGAFFSLAPRLVGGAGPPLTVAIGFPAAVFGVVSLGRAFVRLTD
jgi:hypothetical protein